MDFIIRLDNAILDFIQNNLRTSIGDKIMVVITSLGNGGIIWLVFGLSFLFFRRTRLLGIFVIISITISALIGNEVIKPIVQRMRPFTHDENYMLLIKAPTGYSFPSGHTISSFACATSIFLYNKRYGIFAIIIACLIGFSRMYLFVHYPTDVIVGMLLGILISYTLYRLIFKKRFASVK